jgi:hypothetical protein
MGSFVWIPLAAGLVAANEADPEPAPAWYRELRSWPQGPGHGPMFIICAGGTVGLPPLSEHVEVAWQHGAVEAEGVGGRCERAGEGGDGQAAAAGAGHDAMAAVATIDIQSLN